MDVHLPDGTRIANAGRKLVRFMENEYDIYDAVEVPPDNTLSMLDILISVAMNSRLDTAVKIRSVWRNKGPVEQALAAIPSSLAVEDDSIPWDAMEALFDRFCEIKYAGPAVATKILHKKRPRLIPILDSIISVYIDGCNEETPPTKATDGAWMVHRMKCFRRVLVGCLDQIHELLLAPDMRRYPISPVRALEVLLWIENEGSGYYRGLPQE
jgi:hypothetical protein